MKRLVTLCMALVAAGAVRAQAASTTGGAEPRSWGKAPACSEFMSYDTREAAEARTPGKSAYYIPLQMKRSADGSASYATEVDAPIEWRERDIFLSVEGASTGYTVYVDGTRAGYSPDAKTPARIRLSPFLTDGKNEIAIRLGEGLLQEAGVQATPGTVALCLQPRTRIADFTVCAQPYPASTSGKLQLEVVLSNSYNYDEKISIGYDIYSPAGALLHYDRREMTLGGNGCDTARFEQEIRGGGANLWTPAKPNLYRLMMIVWRDGRIIEYVPAKIAFTQRGCDDNLQIVRSVSEAGKVARYNVAPGDAAAKVKTELAALKKKGAAMIRVGWPQPAWFYDLCDEAGIYVIDQANIDDPYRRMDRGAGGTPANDPRLADAFLERQRAMHARTHNHPCIVAWSMGEMSGNGYNMYKSYLLLKSLDPARPVIYDDAQGEWNTDL